MRNFIFIVDLLGIFLIVWYCNCQKEEIEVFSIVFLRGNQLLKIDSNNPSTVYDIASFNMKATGLVASDEYLYVSVHDKHSVIWRAKITETGTSSFVEEGNQEGWKTFDKINDLEVSRMTLVKEYLIASGPSGVVWRCNSGVPNSCKVFYELSGFEITGMDYNPGDGKMYFSGIESLFRCFLDSKQTCEEVSIFNGFKDGINTIRISFGTLWVGLESELWKCSLDRTYKDYIDKRLYCEYFDDHSRIKRAIPKCSYIVATNKYLYVNTDGAEKISRCDPGYGKSCIYAIPKPNDMGPFIIDEKNAIPKSEE